MIFDSTPSQTVGPYFEIGMPWENGPFAVSLETPGAIRIGGFVRDGAGEPVRDALVETWQADGAGRLADMHGYGGGSEIPGFRGFARCICDDDGRFEIVTVKPGSVPGLGGAVQAPHIDVSVFARGMLHRCVTRLYFADEAQANAADAVLASVPAARQDTLLAQPVDGGGYRFDIVLQGPDETVFFAV